MNKFEFWLVLAAAISVTALPVRSSAQNFTLLHTFGNSPDGDAPYGGVILDAMGNLYGTTAGGGTSGTGVVFKLGPHGNETLLYSFGAVGSGDGSEPLASLTRDNAGNLYGTTTSGGTYNSGTVFKVTPGGKGTLIHSFQGVSANDGAVPEFGTLIRDGEGNFYGTTALGGLASSSYGSGAGTIFKIGADGTEAILHSFTGEDGAYPDGGVIADASGNLYGTTSAGGLNDCTSGNGYYGCGVVFEITPTGKESLLNFFGGTPGGITPQSTLVRDELGNLYGTTMGGGGIAFELSKGDVEKVLFGFGLGNEGDFPLGTLIRDKKGNLYGTTLSGGTFGYGVVYELDSAGHETVLWNFTGGSDGAKPYAGLVVDTGGNLYGTASEGGAFAHGTVFKITP